ncbi:peroxidase family protein [Rhizobium herbae]
MADLNKHDLQFILKQIKIAEATSGAASLNPVTVTQVRLDANGNPTTDESFPLVVNNPLIPYGLRTVNGSYNNIVPGSEYNGSADQIMPRLLDPVFLNDQDGDTYGSGPTAVTNTNYGSIGQNVADADPRIISNLISDQTLSNPAVIITALSSLGHADPYAILAMPANNGVYVAAVLAFQAADGAERELANANAALQALSFGPPPAPEVAVAAAARVTAAQTDLAAKLADKLSAYEVLEDTIGITMEGDTVFIENVAPDLGDTAPFNGFFTLFGQFFDHGLDLVSKGGAGTVYIPLQPDDPLFVEGSRTNFMVLTRATPVIGAGADGQLGTADDTVNHNNETTPWIDLNQVYTSNASHQVFLREYVMVDGKPVSTGRMLESPAGGPATWADVKLQASEKLGILLTDADVLRVPGLLTDQYGEFVRGANGLPQLVTALDGPVEGNLASPVAAAQALSAGRAFLNDIAHNAVPTGLVDHDRNPGTAPIAVLPDADEIAGNVIIPNMFGIATTYDNELLDKHVIVGDGRGNENIGLTSVHHLFHSEHNRQVEETKATILASGDLAFINEWLAVDVATLPTDPAALTWDGERLFQAGRFATEMVYQHLVFEEFARAAAPDVDPFLFSNTATIDGAIVAEFAHVVYRFGHSMLTDTIDILGMSAGGPEEQSIGLIEAFLNPVAFEAAGTDAEHAAGAILRGMTRQAGNEIDEHLTDALRNNLVGLPLDLGAVNIARARETGVPSLNEARSQFYADTQDTRVKPYDSWYDFALSMKNPASLINFIAAYGSHGALTGALTLEQKRDVAASLVLGDGNDSDGVTINGTVYTDRLDFLNGRGVYAGGTLGGLNTVDFWIGGLAEKKMSFGSMLGSSFTYVFEYQMESLQAGDRFYYLSRTQGLNLLNELEADSFAQLIKRNTVVGEDGGHINGSAFQTAAYILEVDQSKQLTGLGLDGKADPLHNNPVLQAINPMVDRTAPAAVSGYDNSLRYSGLDHVVLGGTGQRDILIGGEGDDTLWGGAGNDRLEGGYGVDHLHGGDGDDIITDSGTDIGAADVIHGDAGNDVINPGSGLDLVFGGDGQDFIFGGSEAKTIAGGEGNDFVRGGTGINMISGNEGDDWLEGGESFDTLAGENSELFFNSTIIGHDILNGRGNDNDYDAESGDDIMFQGAGIERNNGMAGFDWAIHKGNNIAANSDMNVSIFTNQQTNILRDRFDLVEGLSGWKLNDNLRGREIVTGAYDANGNATQAAPGAPLDSYSNALLYKNVSLIDGLSDLVGHLMPTGGSIDPNAIVMDTADASDILLGGGGGDRIEGMAGNDIIDGDRWLNVRIRFDQGGVGYTTDSLSGVIYREADYIDGAPIAGAVAQFAGQTLDKLLFSRTISAGQLDMVREIVDGGKPGDVDTAVYWDVRDNYSFTVNGDGSITVEHVNQGDPVIDLTSGRARASDGIDRLYNIERIEFADNAPLNIIVGTPGNDVPLNGTAQDDLILGLAGNDTLNGLAGNDILIGGPGGDNATYIDNFTSQSYSLNGGTENFAGAWTEGGGETASASGGDITVSGGRLQFNQNVDGGEFIQRSVNLAGATTATLTFAYEDDDLGAGQSVIVEALNVVTGLWETLAGGTLGSTTGNGVGNFSATLSANQIGAGSAIRFRTTGDGNNWDNGDNFYLDDVTIAATIPGLNGGIDTLNGGLGNDMYSFSLGDGNDVINESVSGTSGGMADRISIVAPITGVDANGLPIHTIAALNANDNGSGTNDGDLIINYSLPSGASSVAQTITVVNHFDGTNAETGVERINFNNALFNGYQLGADDYLISRADSTNNRVVNLATSTVNNFVAGENGANDAITGGSANDLIFGGGGNDLLNGGLGADLLVGGADNDTYLLDDLGDVVVEAAGAGRDTVQTLLAALSLELMANVEDLTYVGADADQFVGTGNSLDNEITGGDLADTLSGLAGNDTLNGGLGADTMTGGDGNDVYEVDEAGDAVIETNTDFVTGGLDRVESDIDYTLGANVENMDLNGTAIRGTGNSLNNVINGNGQNNQLFGAGGNDALSGAGGDDLLDGGDGIDTLNGGDGNDTIIGGAGNDTIDVGGGFNTIVYNALAFGNDIINSFDTAGGSATNQDLIDLSAFGLTAANIGTTTASRIQIQNVAEAGPDDTLITIRDAGGTVMGTIHVEDAENAITASDFILAVAPPPVFGAPTNAANTITGNAAANLINGLGGNDTLSGAGGDDVINGGEGADTLNGGDGNDTLSGGAGSNTGAYVDNFGADSFANSDGTIAFAGSWTETGAGEATSPTAGDIQITAGRLRFGEGTDGDEIIQRSINLAGATAASLSFAYEGDDLDAGESVAVEAFNGTTWQLLGTLGGDTNGTANFTAPLTAAHTAIRLRAIGTYEGGENFFVDNFTVNATIPNLNAGVDTVNGDAGDDTIIWNANAAAPTDGRDLVNGGTEGAVGDTFVINGNASMEDYRIYTRAAFLAVVGNAAVSLAAATEIVVTRGGTNASSIIAELAEIEEIRVNGSDPSGTSGTAGNDNFEIIGDFSTTSLRLNTITIDGSTGDDTIDISALRSAHRLVFRSNGGNDTIIGTLRAQDVIELPNGAKGSDYQTTTDANGVTTMTRNGHTITFCRETDDDDNGTPPPVAARSLIGTSAANNLVGAAGDDVILGGGGGDILVGDAGNDILRGEDGDDVITAGDGKDSVSGGEGSDELHGGAGVDMLFGDAGDDLIHGDGGDDLIEGGAGDDQVWGGEGDDTVIAKPNDGSDRYWGGDGADTLDYSAALGNLTVDLGNGFMQRGSVTGSNIGSDTFYGFENFVGGTGHDTITATTAVNIMDGGAGNDTFRFTSTGAINDDVIYGFQPGDKIDFSPIDANTNVAGKQGFALATSLNAAGKVVVFHEVQDGHEVTVIHGNVDGTGVDFELTLDGKHNLTASDFQGVS